MQHHQLYTPQQPVAVFTRLHKSLRQSEKAIDISHVGGVSDRRMLNGSQRRKDLNFKQQQCKKNLAQHSILLHFYGKTL